MKLVKPLHKAKQQPKIIKYNQHGLNRYRTHMLRAENKILVPVDTLKKDKHIVATSFP